MPAPSNKVQMIRLIRVAARDLAMDDDSRRHLQLRVVGKASLSDMTPSEMEAVVAEMKRLGFRAKGGHRPAAERADTRFAHKLWGLLFTHGKVHQRGAAGLNAFVRERFGTAWGAAPIDIDRIHDADKIAAVVEALKAMCRRAQIAVDVRGR